MPKLLKPSEWPGFPKLEGPHDPWWPIQEAGWPVPRETSLAFMPRAVVADFPGVRDMIVAHPAWELDPITDNAYRRSSEFLAMREKSEAQLYIEREEAVSALRAAWDELESKLIQQGDGISCPVGPFGAHLTKASISGRRSQDYVPYSDLIEIWRNVMLQSAGKHLGLPPETILLWREPPEISGQIDFGETKITWTVYCRYAVTLSPFV